MPKFAMDINGVNDDAAAPREQWTGEVPPTGAYVGRLKIMSMDVIGEKSKNAGKPKINIRVDLENTPDGKYDGFPAWGSLNLIESAKVYINQFLLALTDGSDEEFTEVKKAFYNNLIVDERKKHVVKFGKWKVESPEGELLIRVQLKTENRYNEETKETYKTSRISDFLLPAEGPGPTKKSKSGPEEVVEEEDETEVDVEDEDADDDSILDDDDE